MPGTDSSGGQTGLSLNLVTSLLSSLYNVLYVQYTCHPCHEHQYCCALITDTINTIVELGTDSSRGWVRRGAEGSSQMKCFHIITPIISQVSYSFILRINLSIITIILRLMRGKGSEKQTPPTGPDGYRHRYSKVLLHPKHLSFLENCTNSNV